MPLMETSHLQMQRVVVIGTSCSGKTTFARNLAHKWNVPHIELDAVHWQPNWTPIPRDEFRAQAQEAVAPKAWVLDGNYSAVRDIVWARATALVWLNYSFSVVALRALRRTLRRSIFKEPMWAGNTESLRHAFFSRDSILWWVLTTYRKRRRDYPLLFQKPENCHLSVTVFTSPSAAEHFLQTIELKP